MINSLDDHLRVQEDWCWRFNPSIVVKSVFMDTPPPEDNLFKINEEYERRLSNEDVTIEFYWKLDSLKGEKAINRT